MSDLLQTTINNLTLQNPILTASGTFGSGSEYTDFVQLDELGAVVTKSVTLRPTRGNPPPRVVETPSGMLNAIGLQNEGVEYFLENLLPPLREKAQVIVANVAGKAVDDYLEVAKILDGSDIDAMEINISCPNVKEGGMAFGVCGEASAKLIEQLKTITTKPLWIKLSPNVTDIVSIAKEIEAAGADAIVAANTFLGMAIDIEKRKPILANKTGGLSGPAIHPLSLRCVYQVAQAVKCPVIASGGVQSIREVIGFLLAGASAVEVGMSNFSEPGITRRLIGELKSWCESHETTVSELIGGLKN